MMLSKITLLLGTILLFLLLWIHPTPAQSNTHLQADLLDLRFQISQLRSQIAQLSQDTRARSGGTPAAPSPRSAAQDRQMLDRLATLAMEAKDRLTDLETRVSRLEQVSH